MTTKIEWTNETWNPLAGCSKVSAGCKNCYAIKEAHRLAGNPHAAIAAKYKDTTTADGKNWTGVIHLDEETLTKPLSWKKPRRVFVNSMSDLFHEGVDDFDIQRIFDVMYNAPQHTFQILTKRPERMRDYLNSHRNWWGDYPQWQHVWLGVSVENQETADERIPLLLQTPAAVRWLSVEPLLGPIDFGNPKAEEVASADYSMRTQRGLFGIDWVVVGGESGHGARPMHPDWTRSLRDQCVAAGVPFFFKQHGNFLHQSQEYSDGLTGAECSGIVTGKSAYLWPDGTKSYRVSKQAAGRILDGRTWDEFPSSTQATASPLGAHPSESISQKQTNASNFDLKQCAVYEHRER